MRLNIESVRNPIMNAEHTNYKSLQNTECHKSFYLRGFALSFSLFLGACASTGEKIDEPPAKPKVEQAKQLTKEQDKTPAPTAAELMKTLKAPLVAPPEAKVEPVTSVKEALAPASDEIKKKQLPEPIQKQVETKSPDLVKKQEVAENVVKKQKAPEKAVKTAQNNVEVPTLGFSAKPFNVSTSSLPFTYDIWTIKQGNTPLTQGLVIATPTWEMGKEGYTSQIWLTMMEDKIHVNSSSDIETVSKGLGIRIDGGELIEFSSIAENNIGVISGQWLNKLAAANKVDIYLGFFPGKKPTSETFSSDLSLKNLARTVATYRMLNQ